MCHSPEWRPELAGEFGAKFRVLSLDVDWAELDRRRVGAAISLDDALIAGVWSGWLAMPSTGAGPVVPGTPTWSDAEAMTRVADWSAEDAELMDTAGLGSVVVTTDDLSVDAIVEDVLQATHWTIGAQSST